MICTVRVLLALLYYFLCSIENVAFKIQTYKILISYRDNKIHSISDKKKKRHRVLAEQISWAVTISRPVWTESYCWCVHTQTFFSSLTFEVKSRDTCVQLLHFCFKYLSYLHCACLNLFSTSTACACREILCILFYFFK